MTTTTERGWLPDSLYCDGRFQNGIAMFADSAGRITRFSGKPEDLRRARRLANRAIVPGMVNVHSHSFQRAIRGRTEHKTGARRDTFWTWREAMYHAANSLSPEDIYDVARMAFVEMLAAGITAVGEFHYLHRAPNGDVYEDPNLLAEQVLAAARETGLRIAVLRTAYARAGWQRDADPGQARFITPSVDEFIRDTEALRASVAKNFAPDFAWVGIAPHSVRAVPLEYLKEGVNYARGQGMKIHMHVSEQPAEIEACEAEYGLRPIELLHRNEILSTDFTGIHAIHITEKEIGHFAARKARIGACPTTERNLGDGIGPADKWSDAGVPTCFGSDSNVQINLLEDARQFEYHLRLKYLERAVLAPDTLEEGLAGRLFESATQCGADSIGAPGGNLAEGRAADFFTIDLSDLSLAGGEPGSLLTNLVFSGEKSAIRDVYVGGEAVIEDGTHRLKDEIVKRFQELQRRLWNQR
jgi:formimidoylglutamate deiminase